MARFTNSDGLTQEYGKRTVEDDIRRNPSVYGAISQVAVQLDYDNFPNYDEDASGGATMDSFGDKQAFVPAGSFIVNAYLVVETAFAGGTNVTIGLYNKAGTAIDADGIDATIATAALAANMAVVCDGALVRGTATVGAADAYLKATFTGTYTAGKSRLVIEYV